MRRTLVIGATSAIAAQVAQQCAARGEALYLLGRDEAKLAALTASLGAAVRGSAAADFTETSGNAARVEEAARVLGGIDSAFIAHGDLGDQLESERSYEHAEHVISVNLLSVISFLVPLANRMEAERGAGRAIVVLSSVAGDRGRPRNYTYGSAKAALNVYLMGLRSRLYGKGVRIVGVRLGPVDTPMTIHHDKNVLFARPEAVATTIVAARDRGPEDVYVPWYWRPIMATVRALPERIFQRFGFLAGR
ncbi:MAG: SDR family NAD(P)-dependent oxidoreductase [Myxococcales bacterium]|nr:SDR family NAD(P)-dependent oxidoreductase [Myxococcales bacterium]